MFIRIKYRDIANRWNILDVSEDMSISFLNELFEYFLDDEWQILEYMI